MKMFLMGLVSIACLMLSAGISTVYGKIETKTVEYTAQGVVMKGYLAWDKAIKGKRPAVLVVHEWWGQNDYVRKRARMLAELGYTALALDMYGQGQVASHPTDAIKFSSELMKNFDISKARFTAALEFIKKQPTVDPDKIAAIGYCFGGGVVLNMARQGADLKGVASFHGGLKAIEPAKEGIVKAKILVLNGADDKFNPPDMVEAFKKEMTDAKVDFKFINYPGAIHSFTNPDATAIGKKFKMPVAYNKDADKKSWEEMKNFLKMIFK